MATGLGSYSTTPLTNGSASSQISMVEGMPPSAVNDGIRQLMADVALWLRDSGWIEFKEYTHTYGSATTTTVAADVTAYYTRGRRVRAVGSSTGTIYGRVVSSSYSAPNTTVTYKWDASGALSSEALAVSLFLGLPETQGGDLKGVINTAKATAVASATSTDIWATNGNLVHVTGTTTIADFGTAPQAGCFRIVIFDDALTLTHGAAAIVIPGGANITTAANDVSLVYADTTTKHLVSYFKADGSPVVGGSAATTTTAGIVELATAAEMETATDSGRVPSVSVVKNHPGVAKAWVKFDGTGTPAVAVSHNVSSITDNGTGDFTVNFTTAFSSGDYCAVGMPRNTNNEFMLQSDLAAPTASAFRLYTVNRAGSSVDTAANHVVFFGDQ